jgi:hypothetical protein
MDQEAHPVEQSREAEIARLLRYPGAGRIGRATGEVDAAACEFDEEEHVEAAQRERLDCEEIAGVHARSLLAEEVAPALARAPRRRPKTVAQQDAPDRARRHTHTELEQLAGDPRVPPARVLARDAQHELKRRSIGAIPFFSIVFGIGRDAASVSTSSRATFFPTVNWSVSSFVRLPSLTR